jgi:integrase/recombinase XerD
MSKLFMDSQYYTYWLNYSPVKNKTYYKTHFKKFEEYLILRGYNGETLNFDFFFCSASGEYEAIDKQFIDEYIAHLEYDQKASKITLYNNIVYLKQFFTFLYDSRLIKNNPFHGYLNKYYERKIIDRALSLEECRLFLKSAKEADPFLNMHYVLGLTMMTTGLRCSEVVQLTYPQINFERNVIHVNQGQKTTSQVVYMPLILSHYLKQYLEHPAYQEWVSKGNIEVFFLNERPFNKAVLNRLIKRVAKDAGLSRTISPQCFRHTTAYLMQLNGVNLRAIQRQLRHKSIATTLRYLPPASILHRTINDYAKTINPLPGD